MEFVPGKTLSDLIPKGGLRVPLLIKYALQMADALRLLVLDGRLPLEESLAAYQRGAELIKFCEGRLTDAQARISVLEGGELRDLPAPK